MKTTLLTIFSFCMLAVSSMAQDNQNDSKFGHVSISTSAICEMCVATIEKGYKFEKGVKESRVDLETNTVTVKYKKGKTDEESIKKALTKMGYSADDMGPSPEAYDDLHHCCKADYDHDTD